MKIPEVVVIFGEVVMVELVPRDDLEGDCGEYCDKEKIIKINKDMDKNHMVATLIHEMGHALSFRISLRQALNHEIEEVIVDSFAVMMDENFTLKPR